MVFLSASGSKNYNSIPYSKDLFLVFGKESVGLDKEVINKIKSIFIKFLLITKYEKFKSCKRSEYCGVSRA